MKASFTSTTRRTRTATPNRRYIRLAVADRIEGPYRDQGVTLTGQPSIDANPNWTAAGDGWMFFTGNEGNDHVGQVLVDRLIEPGRPAGEVCKVFPDETVEWEEGAFLVPHDGKYYLFTSMGNWRDGSYHVLLSVADRPQGPYTRLLDGESPLVILRSHADRLGPGHNSVFEGPDGRPWICFHAWDPEHTGRYPYVAPLRFENGRSSTLNSESVARRDALIRNFRNISAACQYGNEAGDTLLLPAASLRNGQLEGVARWINRSAADIALDLEELTAAGVVVRDGSETDPVFSFDQESEGASLAARPWRRSS